MRSQPTVSVCMITYGHEKFIEQAIHGVLMQETNFEIELIIANDCSPDASEEIVNKLIKSHPKGSLIKYYKHTDNIGIMPNFIFALKQCNGSYVALCEGDDFWIDPNKLQKQVDFLEANDDFIIHSGNARVLSGCNLNDTLLVKSNYNQVFALDDFYMKNNIITCTVMFRNNNFNFPDFFNKITFGDWFLYVMLLFKTNKKVYRSEDVFSVYRIHSGGVMSNLNKEKNNLAHIFQIESIQKYISNKQYLLAIEKELNNYYFEIFETRYANGNWKEAIEIAFRNLKSCPKTFQIRAYLGFIKINLLKKLRK